MPGGWGLVVLLTSALMLGGTFIATVLGALSGKALTAIFVGYAALMGLGAILIALFHPRATLSDDQRARRDATRRAADALAAHRTGTTRGSAFRLERHRFYRNDAINMEVAEDYLVDRDDGTRRLITALLVVAGPEMGAWARGRCGELADVPHNEELREALSRVDRLVRADQPLDELERVFQ